MGDCQVNVRRSDIEAHKVIWRTETHNKTKMSDSEATAAAPADAPIPTPCQVIKEDLDKCVKEKGEEGWEHNTRDMLLGTGWGKKDVYYRVLHFPSIPFCTLHWSKS
ncbi:hypothetical protein MATL_G00214980 [Megalops atlanticus]|uniref:Uncharacterized protein n=1 Tax=Megalops atlanticus TaxID=7932 RepID=A0A9D3T414_MEGAT|nr:hypothetical protein MATL_G00214980 [Megalops atlanticus]